MTSTLGRARPAPTSQPRKKPDGPSHNVARRRAPASVVLLAGVVLTVVALAVSVSVGTAGVSPATMWQAVQATALGQEPTGDLASAYTVLTALRLPRAVLSLTAGASLALAGVLMQALLHNPLVSPFTLGVSPAAAFGAAAAILLLGPSASGGVVALAAFSVALGVSGALLGLAAARGLGAATLLLLGIALTQLFEALTSALQFTADENTLQRIVRWTFGSVNEAQWTDVGLVTLVLAAAAPVALWFAVRLNAVAFAGDDAATSLGVHVPALRVGLITVAVLLAAVVVSTCGIIGFVGLVAPHIARLALGSDHRVLIPASMLAGGLLLLVSDTIGRTIIAPAVVPVGIVVAVVGAPVFIQLVLRRRRAAA